MVKFLLNDSFNYKEGNYEILENTELNEKFSIVLATENIKAVVYLKHFTGKVEKVAEFENPTADEKEKFFNIQFNYWVSVLIEGMNRDNLYDLLETDNDYSFDYYYTHSILPDSPRYKVTIISEKGKVYVSDGNVKRFIMDKSIISTTVYFDLLVKKVAIEYFDL